MAAEELAPEKEFQRNQEISAMETEIFGSIDQMIAELEILAEKSDEF